MKKIDLYDVPQVNSNVPLIMLEFSKVYPKGKHKGRQDDLCSGYVSMKSSIIVIIIMIIVGASSPV